MHVDKKLSMLIVSASLLGGIIGGGVGGALGSFASHEEGGRHHERKGMERDQESDDYSDREMNDGNAETLQTEQVANPTQVPVVTASTTKVN